jgi:uncharacterized membrane protein YfcA
MGLTLGLLGGGGSILAVPILHYVLGLEAKEAITASLFIVGVTSLVVTLQHARKGNVRWRTGLIFGGVAMVGAYAGGLVGNYVPGPILLTLFAAMMLVAGIAMLRSRRADTTPAKERNGSPPILAIAVEGLFVGFVTGLVGAGGGFLVVPALVFFAGFDMRRAIGTSALVVTMKSFAGFAGYATHVQVDMGLALGITAAAVVGSVVGVALVNRIPAARLRRIFGAFVLAMAVYVLARELPATFLEDAWVALFETRWPFWAAGIAIGAFVLMFLKGSGKAVGVSTGYKDACAAPFDPAARRSWRLPFIIGIVGGGLVAALAAGGGTPSVDMGRFDTLVSASLGVKIPFFIGGGILLGFGARLAGGCTSGHGIVGVAQVAKSSLLATGAFMVAGFAVTAAILAISGGAA